MIRGRSIPEFRPRLIPEKSGKTTIHTNTARNKLLLEVENTLDQKASSSFYLLLKQLLKPDKPDIILSYSPITTTTFTAQLSPYNFSILQSDFPLHAEC